MDSPYRSAPAPETAAAPRDPGIVGDVIAQFADPLAFYRGLIDEVDGELGDLLNRRVALTHAVQPHKPVAERDPGREREIAEAMALRAPVLGADRLYRIVHAVITESLDAST